MTNEIVAYEPSQHTGSSQVVLYAELKPMILDATCVQEVKEISDQAQAWAQYWAAKKDHQKAIEGAAAYALSAWKGGELLAKVERSQGNRTDLQLSSTVDGSSYARTLEAAKLSESTAKRWQRISRTWALESVDQYITECYKQNKIPTLQYLLREARKEDNRVVASDIGSWQIEQSDIADLVFVQDASIDVIITDPPYPKEYLPVYSHLSKAASRVLKPGGSCFVMVGQSYLPDIMKRLSEHLNYQWALAYLTPGGQSTQLFQRAINTFWKPVLWYVNGQYSGKWLGDVCQSSANDNDKGRHEWGQSESGMNSLIGRCSERGQVVLDPFCGAGTTGIAAVSMGRHFIGSDIDADRVGATLSRIKSAFEEQEAAQWNYQ